MGWRLGLDAWHFWNCCYWIDRQNRPAPNDEAGRFGGVFLHLKARAAGRRDVQYSKLRHFPIDDAGQRAHARKLRRTFRGGGDFVTARDQANAEGALLLEAVLRHVDVALLEHLERQETAGK